MRLALFAMMAMLASPLSTLWVTELFEYRLMNETEASN